MNSVYNTVLHVWLGAFSRVERLYCEANEPPVWIRGQQILLNYAVSVSSNPL